MKSLTNRLRIGVAAVVLTAVCGRAQAPGQMAFEVASIRLTKPGTQNGFIKAMPGGEQYVAQNIPVKLMISLMWKVPMRQISGGPDWVNADRYDVEAKADGPHTIDDLHTMYQNLLVDRLSLKFHTEVKEGNIYALEVDKVGLKMKANDSPPNFDIPVTFGPDGSQVGRRVDMRYLSWMLGQMLQNDERPVVDRTGLKGFWDFNLASRPVLPAGAPVPEGLGERPSLFDALREQLGLRLVAERGPVEYFVIDHIERPSEN